jgi:hypothetical protein
VERQERRTLLLCLSLLYISYNNNRHPLAVRELILIHPKHLGRLLSLQRRKESLESRFIVKADFGNGIEIESGLVALDYRRLIIFAELQVVSPVAFGEMLASIELEQRHVTGFIMLLEVQMRDARFACNEDKDVIRHCKY